MNKIAKIKDEVFDTVPTLQAENLVSGIWESIEPKIIPDCLFSCFTEDGLASVCGKILESEIFYKPQTEEYFIRVHSQYYKPDTGNIVFYAIRQIGRKLNVLKYSFNGDSAEALTKALKKTTSNSGLKAIFSIMKSEPSLMRMNEEINPHGLIMSPDGSRDPLTGELIIKPGAVFTKTTNFNPQVGAVPVQFYKFLFDIFKINNPEKAKEDNQQETASVVDRLLDLFAAAITGQAPQIEKFLIFTGKGGTGKQQILELLEKILGDYFQWMRPESLYETNAGGDTPRSDLLRLLDSLIIGISEPSDAKLSASLFKTLGSGEPIPCRPHYSKTVIEVRTNALFIILANRKPYITHDSGVDRRLEVYEFNNEFHNTNYCITDIGKKIATTEGEQIFGELIRRAAAWKARGGDLQHIAESEIVRKWTDDYIGWSDVIGRFLSDETTKEPGASYLVSDTYKRFCLWTDKHGETQMSGRALGEALSERGIKKIKKNYGWVFTGIKLNPSTYEISGSN